MEKTLYQGQREVSIQEMDHIIEKGIEEVLEKRIILDFFKEIPIEKLKHLINFKKLHPFSLEPKTPQEYELKNILHDKMIVKFELEIRL